MEKQVLAVILKRQTRESNIARVLEMETKSALPKGENYTSNILAVKLKVVMGNGRLSTKRFIMKQMITGDKAGEWLGQMNLAKSEAEAYTLIHKQMSYLMEEFEDTEEPLWCKFITYDEASATLLMEDLKASGYSLVPRQECQDLDHALVALRGLARYHGMAKVLEERGIICKERYSSPVFMSSQVLRCFIYGAIRCTAKAILEGWGPSWKPAAKELLSIEYEAFAEKFMNLGNFDGNEFQVLNHGDCWNNNMMFKYDWQGRPMAVKFVDYQMPRYTSACVDVSYYMYCSIKPPVRRANYRLLIKSYVDSLIGTLDKFGYGGPKPTLDDFTASMDRMSLFGKSKFLSGYGFMMCPTDDAGNINEILATDGESGFNFKVLKNPAMAEQMGPDVTTFLKIISL